ncbi:MAG TPA: glycoside hydrolase family 31 protein [Candidatus Nitrosotenuis sp.]|jgi:alpha-glucosidase|nr:glycoside hydrolase family 31 protein [Candidatus Nitrosotenuis sp.]
MAEEILSPPLTQVRSWARHPRGIDCSLRQGLLRLALVAPGIVRVRFTPQEAFSPRRSWSVVPDEEDLPAPEVSVLERPGAVILRSGPLAVTLHLADGRLTFADDQGRLFAEDAEPCRWGQVDSQPSSRRTRDEVPLPPGRARIQVRLAKRMHPEEGYFGFGQRTMGLDRRNNRLTNWTVDPAWGHNRSTDNLYQAHPFFLALRPGLAWGLFLHSTWWSRFDVGSGRSGILEMVTQGGELDYFLFYGPTPAGVVERLTLLTGRPMLPPLWALGYHQSRWGYQHSAEIEELAEEFSRRQIPLEVIHLDIDYMWGYRCFTFDPERFPDPAALARGLRERGVRLVTIIDPGIRHEFDTEYDVAREMALKGMYIRHTYGAPFVGFCWPDAAMFPDFAREEVRRWWGDLCRRLLDVGISGIWLDMNEPAIFDRPFSQGLSEQTPMPLDLPQGEGEELTSHAEVHNLYGFLMSRATFEGLRRHRPQERPWILTRSAFTGIQRYAASWMGDNTSWWEHLEMSLPQLASMGLCGSPHVGVDIGGFFGHCTPELMARWMEMGPFYPFMRNHTCMGTDPQEPWRFGPEVEEIARQAIRLRYRLLPYLYTLAHQAHRSGAPILRPLLYEFPDDVEGFRRDDQVMIGPHLMVAPVVRQGHRHRLVWLPSGAWHHWWTGQVLQGPGAFAVDAPLGRIPLFVRAGAVLPLGNVRSSTAQPLTELTLAVYAGGEGESSWIEDDGVSMDYQRGILCETRARVTQGQGRLTLSLGPREGNWQPPPRQLIVRLHGAGRPRAARLDGQPVEGAWDQESRSWHHGWPDDGLAHEVEFDLGD